MRLRAVPLLLLALPIPAAASARPPIEAVIEARGYGRGLSNAAAMNVDFNSLHLAPNSLDVALLNMVHHDLYWESEKYRVSRTDPQRVLAALYHGMKPGGIVGVVDHVGPAGDTRAIVEDLHRIDPATIRADFGRAGFVLAAESDMLRNPEDDHAKNVFDPAIRYRTDRVVYRFVKPGGKAPAAAAPDAALPPLHGAGACDASAARDIAGKPLTEALRDKTKTDAGAKTVRVLHPGEIITMEFRADRLDIMVDKNGTVTAVRCG